MSQVIARIGAEAFKRGIRFQEFFIDYDPLRHDEVTENQFKLALNRVIGKQLDPKEIQQLVNYFQSPKNKQMVSYRQFCREVDFCKCRFQKCCQEKYPSKSIQFILTSTIHHTHPPKIRIWPQIHLKQPLRNEDKNRPKGVFPRH